VCVVCACYVLRVFPCVLCVVPAHEEVEVELEKYSHVFVVFEAHTELGAQERRYEREPCDGPRIHLWNAEIGTRVLLL
jgi:hypothetical protein